MRRLGIPAASAVGEGIELLDIAKGMAGLRLDPCPQSRLQRAVRKFERAARQRAGIGDGHDLRLAVGDGDEDGDAGKALFRAAMHGVRRLNAACRRARLVRAGVGMRRV